ncbi:MAG TPA: 3-phosphoshikimate 1-carboxyvinyltransferase [Candidatus Hydrogenedentes bacterium]|nr:3-phosphoshikimate 1-carboxyvinyltransferase [Candidatus Hydrogenedentota bacterium]HNT88149.1 3-phosphoshikimate 1-carboxyvinyltransferase [Candidatus Hydrogenedentota bacterium]
MKLLVEGSNLRGAVRIPGSKSHTIRAVAISALADGVSVIRQPLDSADARAAFRAYRGLGAAIEDAGELWRVHGTGGALRVPDDVIDVANSGTTMNVALGSAALLTSGTAVLTGDEQVRRRPCGVLEASLNDLGATVRATRGNGCPPFVVQGRLRGGDTTMEAMSSQYVTSLLINAPLGDGDTRLRVPVLHEVPYVHMTLAWLRRAGIRVEHAEDLSEFHIPGGQAYPPVDCVIPADFSSATFFLAAGALPENEVTALGLDMGDPQGDKAVVDYLRAMGAAVHVAEDGIRVAAGRLDGREIDLNATPDALPMMAVLGCFARGETRLVNVPQARFKETDRITAMREELTRLGARIEELEDGLVVHESALRPAEVDGRGDHRIVMALAVAATGLPGVTTIHGFEAVNVTFPTFIESLNALGAKTRLIT